MDEAETLTSEQRLADAAARRTNEQRLDQGLWTTVDVLPEGEVHIAHGPAFECFLTLGLCDCCACSACESRKTAIGTWMDLIDEETGGAGPQALTRGRLSDLFVIAEALDASEYRR